MNEHVKRIKEESYESIAKYIEAVVNDCSIFGRPSFVYLDGEKYFAVDERLGTVIVTEELDSYFVMFQDEELKKIVTDEYVYEYIKDDENSMRVTRKKLSDMDEMQTSYYTRYDGGYLIGFSNENNIGIYGEMYDTKSADFKAYLNFINRKNPSDIIVKYGKRRIDFVKRNDETYITSKIPGFISPLVRGVNSEELRNSCKDIGYNIDMPTDLMEELVLDKSEDKLVKVAKIYQKSL